MVKKKSKFRSILINKKRYYFCKITWLDILGDSGHADANEFNEMKPAEMITHAYVFYNDSKVVKTFASYDLTLSLLVIVMYFLKVVLKRLKR